VAALAAARIDPDEHATLRVALDESRPEYLHIAAELRAVRDDHPQVRYLTTVVVGAEAKATIVVDAEQAPDERAPLGSEIFADDELLETFAGASPDVNVLYVDQWGVWVSGLATVRDRRGEVVAIVQADIPPAGLSGAEMAGLRSDVAQAFAAMFQAAEARRGGHHRRSHRSLQPSLPARAAVGGGRARPPGRPATRPAGLRPRPVQDLQRALRPQRG
jgi:hypothetical protein